MARLLHSPSDARAVLQEARTVAVLGAHSDPSRPAFYVPDYLHSMGYRIVAVNPALEGARLWGGTVLGTLDAVPSGSIDLLDVFRRAELLPAHVDEILRLRPRVAWFQSGIRNDAVAARLVAEGIDVVQDRCTYADHRAFGLPPVPGWEPQPAG